jgi:hypothetical protein
MNNLDNIKKSGFKIPNNYFESLEDSIYNALSEDSLTEKNGKSGMQIPDNYFDDIEDRIITSVSEKSLLEKTKTGFNVSKDYFKTLEDTIIQKIEIKQQPKVVSLFSRRNLLYVSGIAAAVVILFSLNFSKKTITFENINLELAENYILDQGINSYELASLLNDEDIDTNNFISLDTYGDDLENYLLENTDIEELIIE